MKKRSKNSELSPLVIRTLAHVVEALSQLQVGDRIPSEESVATSLSVSRTTVREAIQLLEARQIITREGRGRYLARKVIAADYPADVPDELPKVREVVQYLLEAIGQGEIIPGQRFSELTITQELGCSASPVREALISLAPLGLFKKDDRRQWVAVALDERQIEELTEMRALVEGYGLTCLIKPKTLEIYRARLERLLEQTRQLGDAKRLNVRKFSKLDVAFHHILLEAPNNRIFLERNEFMYALVEFQLHNKKFSSDRARLGLQQHLGIMEAILRLDLSEARLLLERHLKTAEETLKWFRV